MAENPASWGPIEKAIAEAMKQHNKDMDAGLYGLSVVRVIADQLRKQGLIKEPEPDDQPHE